MKSVQLLRFCQLFLFVFCLSLKADNRDHNEYIYLHDAEYNIADWVKALTEIDDDATSSIRSLKDYIAGGEKIALRCEIMQVLEYVQGLLAHKRSFCDDNAACKRLISVTNNMMKAVEQNVLSIPFNILENIQVDDGLLMESVSRVLVKTNLILPDSHVNQGGMLVGNIIKRLILPGSRAVEVRFIHNYGIQNTFVGARAGNFTLKIPSVFDNSAAMRNTGIGADALRSLTLGSLNTAVGKDAARQNTDGNDNVAVGYNALSNKTVGSQNIAIGDSALVNLKSLNAASDNLAVGRNALRGLIEGNNNVAVGALAGYSSEPNGYAGSENVFVGSRAGNSANPGSNNIYVGNQAGVFSSGQIANIYIGHKGAQESNTIRIGTRFDAETNQGQKSCHIAGIRGVTISGPIVVVVDSNGQLGIIASSQRFKDNIRQIHEESEVLYNLDPVSFVYKNDTAETTQYGLIAEEVDQYFPRLVVKDNDGAPYTVRYELLPVLLLNEMQKHQHNIQSNKNNIKKQKQDIQKRQQKIEKLQQNIHIQNLNIQEQEDVLDSVLRIVDELRKKINFYMAD